MGNQKRRTPEKAESRLSSGDQSKGVSNGQDHKKRKLNEDNHQNKLIDFITDFKLTLNELFQLKEYASVVEWDPADFFTGNVDSHRLFSDFLKEPHHSLKWSNDDKDDEKLNDMPLRLQKKVLAEREKQLVEKYPFKDSIIQASIEKEHEIIRRISTNDSKQDITDGIKKEESEESSQDEDLDDEDDDSGNSSDESDSEKSQDSEEEDIKPITKTKAPKSNGKSYKPDNKRNKISHYSESEESDPEVSMDEDVLETYDFSNLSDVDTDFHLKQVKFSVNTPKVTHPSHIPSWIPPKADNVQDEENQKVIDFNPTPINLISNNNQLMVAPEVENRLHEYLENKYKAAIIDEGINVDYNNTPEEAKLVLAQQSQLLRDLYKKTTFEKSLELNNDKIEKRKLGLPQASTARQVADPFRATMSVTPKSQGLTNTTHIDNLLTQGMAFSRLHNQVRKQRQLRIRKIATMVEQHFKWKRGEKERIAKEREQNLKRISRLAIQAVKKRWNQAYRVYRHIQNQKEEELKKIRGKEHLSSMLEHSTQLLEAQLHGGSQDIESGSGESEGLNDSNGSSSSSDSDDEGDDNLSVEKLREKYGNLTETTSTNNESESEDSEDESDSANGGLSALYDTKDLNNGDINSKDLLEYSEDQKALIQKYEKEGSQDRALSESESDSESDSSMVDDSSSEEESSSDEEVNEKKAGLASLFDDKKQTESESEDASAEDSNTGESSDDDRMSSTTSEEDEPTTPKSEITPMKNTKESELPEQEVNGSKVRDVPIPPLLRGDLRPYQKQGLNWMASLYNNDTNGILADEMGLGKTIQTIALLAHLASEYHIWGPHLIVVPTSVMLNWEMEFKKFAPGMKILTYYGSPQQRAQKRKGWNKPDAFHVCITSYQLVVHDHQSFKRRRWRYMILDEAHNIKNFRSSRWKALLNFNTENRLLLTGTPLQNNLMELWSLLYFLMPSSKVNQAMPEGFANLEDFQQWFGKPVDNIVEQASSGAGDIINDNESTMKGMDEETKNTVARLHQVLRPYILRRLKADVEQQMPGKYEHVVYCRLSKRQRFLYDDFMSRAKTKETLASGNFLSIINCLMQLRKVCNHPDLFEVRPIVTSFAIPDSIPGKFTPLNDLVEKYSNESQGRKDISLPVLNLDITGKENLNYFTSSSTKRLQSTSSLQKQANELNDIINVKSNNDTKDVCLSYYTESKRENQIGVKERLEQAVYLNQLRCDRGPVYGESLLRMLKSATFEYKPNGTLLDELILPIEKRVEVMKDTIENYSVLTPAAVSMDMKELLIPIETKNKVSQQIASKQIDNPFHQSQVKLSIAFPDKSLLQYDCGKLQKLDKILQELIAGGHRALIFTQMTKVLDILEQFLNIHGHRYLRLDGATKIEDRQLLTEKFNRDAKIPVFILSSRSGGLGINLAGADTVIFYDSDWNPAMDKQCQDRCHRIGQMRDVHIYRFVSEHTIESNILRKANQKRQLDNVVIQEGDFTTDYFGKFSVRDLVNDTDIAKQVPDKPIAEGNIENALMQAEDEDDRQAANSAMKEVAVDDDDFNEDANNPNGRAPENRKGLGGDDLDYEEGIGHIDEYMLNYIANGYYGE